MTTMEKAGLPPYTEEQPLHGINPAWKQRKIRRTRGLKFIGLAALAFIVYAQWRQLPSASSSSSSEITAKGLSVKKLQEDLAVCAKLRSKPTDPIGLGREKNARYIEGHKPTLIKNATVWVGEPVEGTSAADARKGKGWEWISADVYLEYGLIKRVEKDISLSSLSDDDVLVYEAKGRPLTAGLIDMHSHAGVYGLPALDGNADGNEMSSDITPYARSIDGIQTDDYQIQVIKSGGVTTSLVLPGSGNNMGGEAYAIKHAVGKPDGRNETSATDMLADPERNWRFMKMACGENAKRVYGKAGERGPFSRMGESWEFRHAFEQASEIVRQQDDWCNSAELGLENVSGYLPQEIKWESLAALLRGQVHLNTHCYTVPDLEAFVDHTNEFKFIVRAFHHAHQTYLVPEILKRAYGGDPPASAIFATNMWYKAESYVGSPYAGKHLYDNNLTTIYVSDNPVLNAQHVVFEAAKGYKYGLPYHVALAAVTTAPAERMGFAQRLGKIKPGFDADVVVWDSDPLSVGAAPVQVWIDGTAQFDDPVELKKPAPEVIVPDLSLAEINEDEPLSLETVVYTGISKVLIDTNIKLSQDQKTYNAIFTNGKISCLGSCTPEVKAAKEDKKVKVIDLENGYLVPSFVAFGSMLGLNAIDAEDSTADGHNTNVFVRAIDGLALDTKKINTAHKWGVTRAISAPVYTGVGTHHGVSVGFLTGAASALESGAVFADEVAVHYTLDLSAKSGANTPSISAAVGALRHKLIEAVANINETLKDPFTEPAYLVKVVTGKLPLVITVHSADTIAAVLRLKSEIEAAVKAKTEKKSSIRLVIFGGAESHLVASELAKADVGVILAPLLSARKAWDERRALIGAPLNNGTAIDALLEAGVTTAIGVEQDWIVYDLAMYAGIAYQNGGGRIGEKEALGLVNENLFKMLGMEKGKQQEEEHFVVYEGSPFEIGSRIKAVGAGRGVVNVFE